MPRVCIGTRFLIKVQLRLVQCRLRAPPPYSAAHARSSSYQSSFLKAILKLIVGGIHSFIHSFAAQWFRSPRVPRLEIYLALKMTEHERVNSWLVGIMDAGCAWAGFESVFSRPRPDAGASAQTPRDAAASSRRRPASPIFGFTLKLLYCLFFGVMRSFALLPIGLFWCLQTWGN